MNPLVVATILRTLLSSIVPPADEAVVATDPMPTSAPIAEAPDPWPPDDPIAPDAPPAEGPPEPSAPRIQVEVELDGDPLAGVW